MHFADSANLDRGCRLWGRWGLQHAGRLALCLRHILRTNFLGISQAPFKRTFCNHEAGPAVAGGDSIPFFPERSVWIKQVLGDLLEQVDMILASVAQ